MVKRKKRKKKANQTRNEFLKSINNRIRLYRYITLYLLFGSAIQTEAGMQDVSSTHCRKVCYHLGKVPVP